MASRLEQAQQALQNPNVRAFLDMLSAAEHTEEHGYHTAFGGAKLAGLQDHPRTRKGFTQTDGKKNTSSAAGRYQFLERTWDDVAEKLKLPDFGAQSQDLAAVELLNRAGALNAVMTGDFATAVQKSGKTWASLPSSPYAQPKRSMEFITARLPKNSLLQDLTTPPAWAARLPPLTQPGMVPTPGATPVPMPGQVPAATPLIPATQPGAVSSIIDALRPQAITPIADEQVFTAEDDAMLAQGLAADVSTQRGEAVAKFFGEAYMPDLPLPDALDKSINRYLALL